MMSKFIELHAKDDKAVLSINIENIVGFGVDDSTVVIRTIDKGDWFIAESYDEVKVLIKDAGVLIHKADPRLDTTIPLTMEDLKYMEGEPVWNSNTLKWMIVHRYGEGDKKSIVWLVRHDSQFELMTADDLIKFPLYRMVQR